MIKHYKVRVFFGDDQQKDYDVDDCSTASFAMRQAALYANKEGKTGLVQVAVIKEAIAGKIKEYEVPIRCDFILASDIWTKQDNQSACAQGWNVSLNMHTHYCVHKNGVRFSTNAEAVNFVKAQSEEGDLICRKAVEFLIMAKSPQIGQFRIVKSW